VPLRTPSQVQNLLLTASKRRTVACTLMNERSSRSHSVFTLRICGKNDITGEACEGSLNLVDLAGSERLKEVGHGGKSSEGKERLKETQSINRSLSALGDVIAALGNGGSGEKHVPYRNSKVTFVYGEDAIFELNLALGLVTAHVFVAEFVEREFENSG
jgi:kinesin family protein C1